MYLRIPGYVQRCCFCCWLCPASFSIFTIKWGSLYWRNGQGKGKRSTEQACFEAGVGGRGWVGCEWMSGELRHWLILLWVVFSSKSLYREPRYFPWKVKSIQKFPMESREHSVYRRLISESHRQHLVKPSQCCWCLNHKFTHNSGELKAILQPSHWCLLYW